jgi:hypothetical protein
MRCKGPGSRGASSRQRLLQPRLPDHLGTWRGRSPYRRHARGIAGLFRSAAGGKAEAADAAGPLSRLHRTRKRSPVYSLDQESPPDFKESFSIGPVDFPDDDYQRAAAPGKFFAPNLWPQSLPDFRPVWQTYYREMERVATALMRIFAAWTSTTSTTKSTAT